MKNKGENAYTRVVSYYCEELKQEEWVKDNIDPSIQADGVCYTFHLPTNVDGMSFSNFITQLYATAYVQEYTNLEQHIAVYSKYAHTQLEIALDFGWTARSQYPGVTIKGALKSKEYGGYFRWCYKEIYK